MAKIAIKYDNIVPYGGIFYAMNEFRRTGLYKLVDGRLDLRCANYGYQYSDIMLALFCVYGPRGIVRGGQMPLPNQRQ